MWKINITYKENNEIKKFQTQADEEDLNTDDKLSDILNNEDNLLEVHIYKEI